MSFEGIAACSAIVGFLAFVIWTFFIEGRDGSLSPYRYLGGPPKRSTRED